MRRSLTAKLAIAFLLVSITGTALAVVFGRWAAYREFDTFVLDRAQSTFVAEMAEYYQANGSWDGVQVYYAGLIAVPPAGQPPGEPPAGAQVDPQVEPPPSGAGEPDRPWPGRSPLTFALVDVQGVVVLPAGSYTLGDQVPAARLSDGAAVEVDGQVVGTALFSGEALPLAPQEQRYLDRSNRVAFYAAGVASLIALVLGVLLARRITRPVRELTVATQAVARGELGLQVPVRSRDELGRLAESFNQMSDDLARSNELRRQMTADIAHDLRTPITVMAGYLESLRDGVLPPSQARFETLYQEAQLLKRLVEDLRILSLADAGELALNREPVPPGWLLEQAAAAHRHQAGQQQVDLQVQVAPDLPAVTVDPDRMAQVLGNLIGNALRYTAAGGHISLSARRENHSVLLAVQDDGQGIAPDALPHIFDRFYRGDETRHEDGGESGLGLAIARSLVELHGGTLSAASTPGQGSTFTIALPLP